MPPLPKTKATAKRGGLREGQSCLSNYISNAERGVAFSAEGFLYVISIKSYELDNACFVLKKKNSSFENESKDAFLLCSGAASSVSGHHVP